MQNGFLMGSKSQSRELCLCCDAHLPIHHGDTRYGAAGTALNLCAHLTGAEPCLAHQDGLQVLREAEAGSHVPGCGAA